MYCQKRVKGGRKPLPATVLKGIWKEVDRQAKMFNVSRSFVIATALSHVFHVSGQEDYKTVSRRRRKKNER